MSPHLWCRTESIDRRTEVITVLESEEAFYGELEPCLWDAISVGKQMLVVDLTGMDRLWPTVLMVLLRAQRRLSWRQGLVLAVCRRAAHEDLVDSGLDGAFPLFETREAALGFATATLNPSELEAVEGADGV